MIRSNSKRKSLGFTLVELLVVITILGTLTALLIPRLRAVTQERNIRESSRVVGSLFANASQRASIDGSAGVLIRRNPNFIQGNLNFAATELSLMRAVPSYKGDQEDARASNNDSNNIIDIDMPLEQEELGIIQVGDSISFNKQSTRYVITQVQLGQNENDVADVAKMRISVELNNYLPPPANDVTYTVHRRPRELRSSRATIPNGFIIDLRFSGFEVLDNQEMPSPPAQRQLTTIFEPEIQFQTGSPPVTNTLINYDIMVLFDKSGGVSQVLYSDGNVSLRRMPLGPLFLFVTAAPKSVDPTGTVPTGDDDGLWVNVSNGTGSTNVGYNDPLPTKGMTFQGLQQMYVAPAGDPNGDRGTFNGLIRSSRVPSGIAAANN